MKLFSNEQIKAMYTKEKLSDLVRSKAAIANRQDMIDTNPSYRKYNKDTLIIMIRDLDKSMETMHL